MYYLGLDVGTTGTKALLVDSAGTVLGKGYAGYELISNGCCVEQRPDDWIKSSVTAIRQAIVEYDPKSVSAISLSTQGASMVAIDSKNQPLGNAWTWMDTRSKNEANELKLLLGEEYIYRNTGWPISPSLDACKILRMKRSGEYKEAKSFITTHEYMALFLSGNAVCDPTNLSIRQLFNVPRNDYDDKILDAIGASRDELPLFMPAGTLIGELTAIAADATGLSAGIPIYNGAHDQYCASLGAAAINSGDILLSTGTTWVVMGISESPIFSESRIAPASHPISGMYGQIVSLVGSGSSLHWYKDKFLETDFNEINCRVSEKERITKLKNLCFYPYFSGVTYPYLNLNARGTFSGISLEHDKFDFARAIMESAAFRVRQALDDFSSNGFELKTLKVMGGAAKSAFWCNLIAAAIGRAIKVSEETEACAIGAAIIAATGAGEYNSLREAAHAMASDTIELSPDPELTEYMQEKYLEYVTVQNAIMQR